jgi:alcohol dehydrogenase
MKAIQYSAFRSPLELVTLPDPAPPPDGVVVQVEATGLCLSDWHGWMGHDADVRPPHVPGHEWAGTILATGPEVRRWQPGARVTAPFCLGCGRCPQCDAGRPQLCDDYVQPGFTMAGSFAERVAVPHADFNLVALPAALSFAAAALLGCRFATSWRAVVAQGRPRPGEWLAVHGCGGVGLSAILIGQARGARVVAVDVGRDKLALARDLGAEVTIDARETPDVAAAIRESTGGGAQVSIDALGSAVTCLASISCLRKRGRHVQVGLMTGGDAAPAIPMARVIARELEIVGSHGLPAHDYPAMLRLIESGAVRVDRLLARTISLARVPEYLPRMGEFREVGVTVIAPRSDR